MDENQRPEVMCSSKQIKQLGRMYDCGHCGCAMSTISVIEEGACGSSDLLFCENCDSIVDQSNIIFRKERALIFLKNLEGGPHQSPDRRGLLSIFWTRFTEENR